MKSSAHKSLSVLLAALAAPIALSACSGPAPAPAPSASSATSAPSSAPTSASASPSASPTPSTTSTQLLSESQALELYVQSERAQTDKVLKDSKGAYKSLKVTGQAPGTVHFVFTFAKKTDNATAKKYLNGSVPTLQSVLDQKVFPMMTTTGVTNPKVIYEFRSRSGAKIWSHTFSPKS